MTGKDSYHHGALREALLAAALEILENRGACRAVLAPCRRQGRACPMPRPPIIFPTLRALLTGLAVIGFQRFDAPCGRRAMKPRKALLSSSEPPRADT